MRLGLLAGPGDDWREGIEKVKIAEDLGVELVSTGEAWGKSAIPWLAAIALNTSRVTIGTSILNTYSRSPAAIAQDFAMLEELSDGRMLLGLGSSGAQVIEHFHGIPFKKPLTRIREYVEIFDTLIAGEKLNYEGEIYHLQRGFRLDYHRPRNKVPVYIAAITQKSIHQTGAIADGIFPIHWPKHLFGALRDDLAAGAKEAGRTDKTFTVAPYTRVAVLDGTDEDEARWRESRRLLQYYINRMGVFYWQMLERNGFAETVAKSREAWAQQDAEASIAAISDEMVRSCQVIGPIEEVREQLQERSTLGADIQMLYMPPGNPKEVGRWLEALMK
ncbi:MAG: LLM class flavin-dependent oxidoreductase [Chloroflexi bacterium]|nr:LLM class flavin-dependent oxidoreductase [Chloroflexota bacterium]MDA1240141.1 LLM class flavin-dependent oxidoreductase [Chloroflexota bacterium]